MKAIDRLIIKAKNKYGVDRLIVAFIYPSESEPGKWVARGDIWGGSLSFGSIAAAVQTGTVATVSQAVKLFLSPDITIKPGSKLKVTQTGVTTEYSSSGVPAVYPTPGNHVGTV